MSPPVADEARGNDIQLGVAASVPTRVKMFGGALPLPRLP
jgi:hypothetical protein